MPHANDIPTDAREAYEAGKRAGWDHGWREGWKVGMKAGVDHKRSIISLSDEISLPLDFAEFTDEYERESIASIVRSFEYQHFFRPNIAKQAMMKHRQARMFDDPVQMKVMHTIGDHILDLMVFYDNSVEREGPTRVMPVEHGFDSVLED